ncbi:unnamed protein product [Amoebophrya sp. A25]|nr:unnamed protein product [Amoebophrya sp. A25]|eukprot:GSA25T00025230001.1
MSEDKAKDNTSRLLLPAYRTTYDSFPLSSRRLLRSMCVQFCGLNPMGGKPRAGCPKGSIQQTCDALTAEGFKVAIYEEANAVNLRRNKFGRNFGGGVGIRGRSSASFTSLSSPATRSASPSSPAVGGGLKQRFLAQIVTAAEPTYRHGPGPLQLSNQTPRPIVALNPTSHHTNRFDLCEIYLDTKTIRKGRNLTREAVKSQLERIPGGCAELLVFSSGEAACSGAEHFLNSSSTTGDLSFAFLQQYTSTASMIILPSCIENRQLHGRSHAASQASASMDGIDSLTSETFRVLNIQNKDDFRELSSSRTTSSSPTRARGHRRNSFGGLHSEYEEDEQQRATPLTSSNLSTMRLAPLGVGVARFLGLTLVPSSGGGSGGGTRMLTSAGRGE